MAGSRAWPVASCLDVPLHCIPLFAFLDLVGLVRESQVKLKADKVDIAYPPVLQSGGRYDLKVPHFPLSHVSRSFAVHAVSHCGRTMVQGLHRAPILLAEL